MFSLRRYRRLFRTPDLVDSVLASIPGRLPISITALAILLFAQSRSGSFASAGTLSALYVIGLAIVAPVVGRLLDRLGPRPVLVVTAIVYPLALSALVVLVSRDAHPLMLALNALIAGAALPPVTVCMRALYPQLLADRDLLQTAYSLDSALVETIFILGPLIVAAFVALAYPQGALLLGAASGALGSVIFLRSTAIRRWKLQQCDAGRSLLGPLHERRLLALFAVTVLYAAAFGLFEVAVSGLAARKNAPAAAGLILGLASVGSMLGAVVYGARDWGPGVVRHLLYALALMAAGLLAVAVVDNLVWLGLVGIVACAPMSVALAAESTLISSLAPRAMVAESFTWMGTSLLTGISAGIAGGGMLVDRFSPAVVFVIAAAATASSAALGWFSLQPRAAAAVEPR